MISNIWLYIESIRIREGLLVRMFHELVSRNREDGRATGQPQGLESEAYLTVRCRVRGPRTPGRAAISTVGAGNS